MFEMMLGTKKAAVASAGYAMFGGGYSTVTYTDKYIYSTKVISAAVALGSGRHTLAGASNSEFGLFGGGESSAYVDKYTHASGARVQGTNLGIARGYLGASSNSGQALYVGGQGNGAGSGGRRVDRYVYGNDSVSAGTALAADRLGLNGTGTDALGIFHGISPAGNRYDKYGYAFDTWTNGTAGALFREAPAAFTSLTAAFFVGGKQSNGSASNYTERYTYASNAILARGSVAFARYYAGAAGNDVESVIGGGLNASSTAIASTERYTYAGDLWTSSTALGQARSNLSAYTSVPGGF